MFYILFCLALNLLPDAASLAALVQLHAAILSFAIFAFVLYHSQLVRDSKSIGARRPFVFW
jgi:hypothetical protein